MAHTIAERAASGEVLHAPDLTVEQRRELLVWAREQGMEYKEIKRKYGFHESESTLRGWMRNATQGPVPREATFTAIDDSLLLEAVQLYTTGPLDQESSYTGAWRKAKDYIRQNGGTTSAGETTLRERWNAITGYNIPPRNSSGGTRGKTGRGGAKSNTPTKPTASARSTQASTSQNRPTSPVFPAAGMEWGYYPPLSRRELVDVLGRRGAQDWMRGSQAVEEGDEDVEEGEGEEDDEGEEEEEEGEEEESEEEEEEDLHWDHEEYDSDLEEEDGADFS